MRALVLALGILFLSTPAFAQFKIEVQDLDGKSLGSGEFATAEAARAWADENAGKGALGKPGEFLVVGPVDVTDQRQAEATAQAARIQERQEALSRVKAACSTSIDTAIDDASTVTRLKTAIKTAIKGCMLDMLKSRSDL